MTCSGSGGEHDAGPLVEFGSDGIQVAALCTDRLVCLGKYWRSRPLVFSLVGRCHGECGSQN
jgi:hypothetical protein